MTLTDKQIRAVKGGRTIVKLSDGGGLQLWVWPDGAKRWRLAYRFGPTQKTMALGVYPDVSLKAAREARDDARRLLASGLDPAAERRQRIDREVRAQAATFEVIAQELMDQKQREAKAVRTLAKMQWLLGLATKDLGRRPISSISSRDVLAVLRRVEARGTLETARRLRATIGQVFRFAIATGRAEIDPTTALRGSIATPVVQHRAAIIEPRAFGGLLRAIDGYAGAIETKSAMRMAALTFARPGEIRFARWQEIDLENAIWSIPAERMKMRRPHRVPLARQTVTLLRDLHRVTGHGELAFPSVRSSKRCISENTMNAALRRLGYGPRFFIAREVFRSSSTLVKLFSTDP